MPRNENLSLYAGTGRRLYVNEGERDSLIWAAAGAEPVRRAFALVLIHTGCRISEALELTPARIDISGRALVFRTLKKRGKTVYRRVPVPYFLISELVRTFRLDPQSLDERRLWPVTRNTGYRWIKDLMALAKIPPGPHCSPKGLRHGYGVNALLAGVDLNQLCGWMGHADIATTSIYARALGPEERKIARRMWRGSPFQWRGWLAASPAHNGNAPAQSMAQKRDAAMSNAKPRTRKAGRARSREPEAR